ncbi:MAG: hypothetical protein AAF441_23345 [Pseudomonadota bacterium]
MSFEKVLLKLAVLPLCALGITAGSAALPSSTAEAATKKQYRQAMRACKRKYGKTVFKVSFRKNGQIICHYGPRNAKNMTEDQVRKWCRKKYYMSASVRVYKRNGKWVCEWRS